MGAIYHVVGHARGQALPGQANPSLHNISINCKTRANESQEGRQEYSLYVVPSQYTCRFLYCKGNEQRAI